MAVKALVYIEKYEPESDGTYRCRLAIWSGANNTNNVLNDAYFESTTLASSVNASLRGFVEGYIQSEWSVEFNQLLDSVKLLNPCSIL